jgi:hypothetical protein
MSPDLSEEERRTLIDLLTCEIEKDIKFPLSPRVERLKRIRAKLPGLRRA